MSRRSIIKHDRVHFDEVPTPAGAGRRRRACRKGLRLLEQDGVVRAIELTCSCGETTLIELELAAPAPAAPRTPPEPDPDPQAKP